MSQSRKNTGQQGKALQPEQGRQSRQYQQQMPRQYQPPSRPGGSTIVLPRPDQIKAYLDKYVIGQEEAKKVLSVAVYNHYKRILHNLGNGGSEAPCLEKSNIVMLGQTGCGKTYIIKTIARLLDVPCYIQDCTKITESGYVGSDVEECLVGLLRDCDYDVEAARRGIVVLDECDKLAKQEAGASITRDVGGVGVQQSLLKIVEGDTVGVPPMGGRKHPEQPLIYVDTTDILFIATGAFVGLEEIVGRRLGYSGRIGYSEGGDEGKLPGSTLSYVTPHDLREFGMIPEFVGRFPVITNVEALSVDDLVQILSKPKNSLVQQYTTMLGFDDIRLVFHKDALEAVAQYAIMLETGARALRSIMETVMSETMYQAPSLKGGTTVTVTAKMVKERILKKYGRILKQASPK